MLPETSRAIYPFRLLNASIFLLNHPRVAAVDEFFKIARPHLLYGRLNLAFEHLLVSRFLDIAEYADRHRVIRVLHARQHVGEIRIRRFLVMNDEVRLAHPAAKLCDLKVHVRAHANAAITLLAEYERLAMLKLDLSIIFNAAFCDHVECAVVKDVAVLIDLDERDPLVTHGALDHSLKVLRVR